MTVIDHASESVAYLDRAEDWANRDHVELETRRYLVDFNLKLAQIHAILAVAQEVNKLPPIDIIWKTQQPT